jgi:hypothetical protein
MPEVGKYFLTIDGTDVGICPTPNGKVGKGVEEIPITY